jgi:phosphocarrier protein
MRRKSAVNGGRAAVNPLPTAHSRLPTVTVMATASRQVVIANNDGFHARPAMQFVDLANRFSSQITVHKAGDEPADADGKSMMQMIILAAERGTTLRIDAEGDDANEAVDQLVKLVESKFGED